MASPTQRWLRHHVQPYPSSDRVCADIDAVLARFAAFRPKSACHTFDDGRSQLLLCLHGLLPISFRSVAYNIPVDVWLTREYPRQPPIVYVVPTSDMLVHAGKYIDVSGRCNIEYMQHWERKYEGCSLVALLEAMQDQFSRQPPVYAKPKPTSALAPATSTADSHPPPLPPKPATASPNQNAPPLSSQSQSIPPHVLPPTSPPGSPPPPPPLPNSDPALPQYHQPHASPIPPTYRPSIIAPETTNASAHVATSPHQYWLSNPSASPPPVPPFPPLHPSSTSYLQSPSQPPSLPSHHLSSFPAVTPPPPPPSIPPPNLLDEDNDVTSLTTAGQPPSTNPTAVPPPRPPNPELLHLHAQVHQKLTSEMASLAQALSLDSERLRAHQNDLLAGQPAIRDEMARLEAVRDVCRNVAGRLKGSVDHVEHTVAELRQKGDPEVDELVCSTTIVHNQLINLVAEDNAIEDTIYHLHRALNAGRIDLDRFLRTTRILAEEQFMKRALTEKIQNGIPMGMSVGSSWS